MEKTISNTKSSDLYRKIDELDLTASVRTEAVCALNVTNRLEDALNLAHEVIERVSAWLTPSPKLGHQ